MRKNAVKKELTKIDGGVCAPSGFRANGVSCGIVNDNKEDLSLVAAEQRCACACVYAESDCLGAPSKLVKKRLAGYARAVIVNSGIANVYMQGGEKVARDICRALSNKLLVREEEIAIASTGKIGNLPISPVLSKMDELVKGLGSDSAHSQKAAIGIASAGEQPKTFAYSFELGDYTCKIGGIVKGNMHVCPNMATTVCILTTDVAIEPDCLQKAFTSAVNNSLNLLNVDGVSSPNDFACILSSGKAGNYKIFTCDSEYKKFADALSAVMGNVCRLIAKNASDTFATCCVTGARSAKTARAVAKAVAGAPAVRKAIALKKVVLEDVLWAIYTANEQFSFEKLHITINGLCLLQDGRRQDFVANTMENALQTQEILLTINLGDGNYSATSVFCISQ